MLWFLLKTYCKEVELVSHQEPTLMCDLWHIGSVPETELQKSEQEFMALLVLFGFHLVYIVYFWKFSSED